MEGYSFNIIFSKRCNQNCYYCDVWSQNINEYKTSIDINKLNYIIDMFPKNSIARINGGEPGILDNIEKGVHALLNHPNIKYVVIYSNGTIRYKGYDFINYENVFYQEHLILDINDKQINKFYDMDFDPRYKYVIILAPNTTKSLLENYDYFKKIGIFNQNFYFKILVNKTMDCKKYINDVENLIDKIILDTGRELSFTKNVIERIKNNEQDYNVKKMCVSFPYNVYIDFESNVLGHCTMVTSKTSTYPLNEKNIKKNLKGILFKEDEACKNCYMYESDSRILKKCLYGEPINYIYSDITNPHGVLW